MNDELGGYILIPQQEHITPSGMISIALSHFRAEAILYRSHPEDQLMILPKERVQQLLCDPEQPKTFTFVLGERWGQVSLETEGEDVSCLHITIDKYALDYPEEAYLSGALWPPEEPAPVRAFVESWLAISEGVQARFGYFSSFPIHSDETYLNASVLPYLHKGDEARLLQMTVQPNWLLYLGPDLVAQGAEALVEEERKKQPLYLEEMVVQKTTSGGLFVRTHLDAKGGLYPDEMVKMVEGEP
ncbi:MAG TPA: hypothetical protein VFV38_40535 [Ktedonobacteraceae bacterium]|nr:hypothetical protein [Ktedonobacteraceae bacterium]